MESAVYVVQNGDENDDAKCSLDKRGVLPLPFSAIKKKNKPSATVAVPRPRCTPVCEKGKERERERARLTATEVGHLIEAAEGGKEKVKR